MRSFNRLAILAVLLVTFENSFVKADPPATPGSDAHKKDSASVPAIPSAPSQITLSSSSPQASPIVKGKPKATAKARDYLEAGAKLHNKGRYELADRYLKEAEARKTQLTLNEQVVLRVYREKVDEQLKRLSTPAFVAEAPRYARFSEDKVDQEVKSASSASPTSLPESSVAGLETGEVSSDFTVNPKADSSDSMNSQVAESNEEPLQKLFGSQTLRNSDETKQRGRWLLSMAREQIYRGNYDEAKAIAAKVKQMNIPWGRFDDSPEKVTEALEKAEELKNNRASDPSKKSSFDRRTAKARLREARAALLHGELDQAEAIANEVNSWRVGFFFFDDTPAKVFSAIDTARRGQSIRSGEAINERPSLESSQPAGPDPLGTDLESPSNYLKGTRFAPPTSPIELNDLPR